MTSLHFCYINNVIFQLTKTGLRIRIKCSLFYGDEEREMNNIILIGMPGAGKSTIGVVLAKIMRKDFCDTDLLIQKSTGRALQDIIDKDGVEAFLDIEKDIVMNMSEQNCVIATGGSVVLREDAVNHLKKLGTVIYLRASFDALEKRIHNMDTRGIAFKGGQTLFDIYKDRTPIYEKYADIVVDCDNLDCNSVCEKIIEEVN